MKRQVKTFDRPGGRLFIDTLYGVRFKTFVPEGEVYDSARALAAWRADPANKNGVRALPVVAESSPRRSADRPDRSDCAHCGEWTGQVTPHECGGCAGGRFASTAECDLYTLCAPRAWAPVPDPAVRRCIDCSSYRPAPAAG